VQVAIQDGAGNYWGGATFNQGSIFYNATGGTTGAWTYSTATLAAQLTTSRQGAVPAMRATRMEGGYRFDGLIPWCTGAARADYIVAGGATEDGRHVLALLSRDAKGVCVDPPMPLVALSASWTASVRCDAVEVEDEKILRVGEKVLTRGNHLPLGQAFLAMGLCRGAIDLIQRFQSPAAERAFARFDRQLEDLRTEVLRLSQPDMEAQANDAAAGIRGRCNDLALRATHAGITLYKGTGLLAGHPAQRLAREAMFLLVWSCPNPVVDCTVDLLTEPPASCDA
jgi:alkylation response protein AidB-like acyl-CoA dehydrogenase